MKQGKFKIGQRVIVDGVKSGVISEYYEGGKFGDYLVDFDEGYPNFIKEQRITNSRGGKREGSGRPAKAPTKTLSYRVPEKLAVKIDKAIRKVIKQFT